MKVHRGRRRGIFMCFPCVYIKEFREGVKNRAVEPESLKKSESRKKLDKVGKVGFDFLSDFWQKKVPH